MAKTLREFKCRDDLWARVEALAERRGISVDDVLQAALVQLFSKKKKQPEEAPAVAEPPKKKPRVATQPALKRVGARAAPASSKPSPPPPRAPARPAVGARLPPPTGGAGRLPPPGGARPSLAKPPTLYLFYQGQAYSIDQEQFVIGRGAKYSDLAIKDANISRRHCAVVRRNGEYYIKDLESTNGVEFEGTRVDDHKIEEGNTYLLCDHELRFSFMPPA